MRIILSLIIFCFIFTATHSVHAKRKRLTVYCSVAIEWCELMVSEFRRQTGARVSMLRKGSGEAYAQIQAERNNPKADVWWGGTGDPHLQAAEAGLTMAYQSPMNSQLHEWALLPAKATDYKTVGIYMGAVGFAYNTEVLKEKGLPAPKCWKDLIKPIYKDEIQMANPASSGTAYTMLATIIQLFGEEEGFKYLKALHQNVNQYTKSGTAPVKSAARRETTIALTFLHGGTNLAVEGFPIETVAPCEGTGYEIGSVSIIKGARNLEMAKAWVDFSLNAAIQSKGVEVRAFQIPSNKQATIPEKAEDMSSIKLIDYDHKLYGSKKKHKELLDRWNQEVKNLPR